MISLPLEHFDDRPAGISVDTIVIHSMYAPLAPDPLDSKECVELLRLCNVSAHYIVGRDGALIQCVDEKKRAWHAGVSQMPFSDDSREAVNNFSIGVELIGSEISGFTDSQYLALTNLTLDIAQRWPICAIVGHDDIAPQRKQDPGARFEWSRYMASLGHNRFKCNRS